MNKVVNKIWASWKRWWPTIVTVVVAVVASGVLFGWGYVEVTDQGRAQPRNEIIRNYGILIIAFWGAFLAVWRSQIANDQAQSASRQAETSERGLRNERYQKSVEMLGDKTLSIRLGGIYALKNLGLEDPQQFHIQIMEVLSAVVRNGTPDNTTQGADCREGAENIGADVREIIKIIKGRADFLIEVEREREYRIDLRGSFLEGINLSDARFSRVCLDGAKLARACLGQADLTGATLIRANLAKADCMLAALRGVDFTNANLTKAKISGADLTNAYFLRANLAGVDFDEARGLNQDQLDAACQHPDCPPPRNLPEGLNWDEAVAKERYEKYLPSQ